MSGAPLKLRSVGYTAQNVKLLEDVSIDVVTGRRLIILGPNGAGKSLLMRLCHGLITPTAGELIRAPELRHAMVFQRPVLLRRSVRANLEYALRVCGMPKQARRESANEAISRFGFADLAMRQARLLSGGEQQRLAVARAWLTRPDILFLDEPTAHLDPGAARVIEDMIMEFSNDRMTIIMSTHDLGQARRLGDDVAFLHQGRMIETQQAGQFFERPQTHTARMFVGGDLHW